MALLFLKNAVLGPSQKTGYQPVAPTSPGLDPERDGGSSSSSSEAGEKLGLDRDESDDAAVVAAAGLFRINPRIISDATIGLSDGLTVPFALTAGLSALGDTNVVIYGGLAELIAGGISMGLGGYLGAKSEAEAYGAALAETREIVTAEPARAARLVRKSFADFDVPGTALDDLARALALQPERLVDFLMRFHHGLAEGDVAPSRAYVSGLTISAGYFFGGLVPLLPYLFVHSVRDGFIASVVVMVLALFAFGWLKTSLVGERCRWTCAKNGVQMIFLGGVAAGAAMGCVKAIGT